MNHASLKMPAALPSSRGACATLACIWEATAPKPGNVYRGADFEDVSYADFLTSAALVGPVLDQAEGQGVGTSVRQAVTTTQAAVGTNTNLGILLLLAPLAAVPICTTLPRGIADVLAVLSVGDTEQVYEAIRLAQPAGLGKVDKADVNAPAEPLLRLVEAMRLAADRDLVARQYTSNFEQVFNVAVKIENGHQDGLPLSDAIVQAFLQQLAEFPDSLIARKRGLETAQNVSRRAAAALGSGKPGEVAYKRGVKELDFWLRSDGHRLNPGTSADLIAAGLFVLLRDQRLNWPVRFYGEG
jgi:triphosphoribosyl-dephospho-CoA synthase